MATVSNLNIDQGATFSSTIDLNNTSSGVFQLNNYIARGKIRKSFRSQSYTQFACTINENSPAQDTITISLTAAQTKKLTAGRYLYDVEIYNSSTSEVIRILEGQIEVLGSITQANPLAEGIEFQYTEENFVAHTMYHPTTGVAYNATTFAEHTTYMNQGYVHVYPIGSESANFNATTAAGSQGAQQQASESQQSSSADTSSNSPSETETGDGGGGASSSGSGYYSGY
jgi:cobalamin biosynthesis Mg chelatase CobN